jgi:cytidylate kinase
MARDIQALVDQQVRKWVKVREVQDHSDATTPKPTRHPMIAVSRQLGSLGADVARDAARRLEIDLYDREIVERIADNANVRSALVESVDDRVQSAIEDWIGVQFGRTYFAHSTYLRHLSQILLTISQHESAVVLGRGAQFILDPTWTLRVRVIAPQQLRIERIAEREQLGVNAARARVLEVDADRRAFARKHFDRDLEDPRHYDLLVNTGDLPVDLCGDLVGGAFSGKFQP